MIYISTYRERYFKGITESYGKVKIIQDDFNEEVKVNNLESAKSYNISKVLLNLDKLNTDDILIFDGPLGFRILSLMDDLGIFHFGLRNYSYDTVLKLDVFTHNGIRYVFLDQKKSYNHFDDKLYKLSVGTYFKFRYNFKVPKHEVYTLNNVEEFVNTAENMYNTSGELAMDYESYTFPDYYEYKTTGASISSMNRSIYLDFRYFDSPEIESSGIKRFCKFINTHNNNIWVFNKAFESLATYRMCGEFTEFNDVMAATKCDEYSGNLKVSAQYYLRIGSWDDDQDKFIKLYKNIFDKFKSYKELVDYTKTPEFGNSDEDKLIKDTIIKLRECKQDFKILDKYWGGEFACTPIDIVSKYCCMDSFYTLAIVKVIKNEHPIYFKGI